MLKFLWPVIPLSTFERIVKYSVKDYVTEVTVLSIHVTKHCVRCDIVALEYVFTKIYHDDALYLVFVMFYLSLTLSVLFTVLVGVSRTLT